MADQNKNIININNLNQQKNFICGVVEGFYGRPWTPEQRKDLFVKQQKWQMNAYLYAPKDDYKHRAYWRELYTVEEAEHLRALVTEAREHGVTFYYAISPGLDITYSSQKEITALKRKLEQVQQLGCNAFAILFDDIDPEMSTADKEVFHSFAHAQVSITNEIFTHLGQPRFMFCPTQYCSTRAVPNVQTSEYLTTLGSKLAPDIDIMWTGSKVITKVLTVEHIRDVSEVMKRPPVIWDNLHANDYDQARLFLGPYCGRTPDLIRLLRGVVTNPNCEYGPNFVAIHTLAQWSKSSADNNCDNNDAVTADIKLETEGLDLSDEIPSSLPPSAYHPRRALRLALNEWLSEFDRPVPAIGPILQPQIPTPVPILPSVNTCMSVTGTTGVVPGVSQHIPGVGAQVGNVNVNVNVVAEAIQEVFCPTSNPVMNSLVNENKVVVDGTVPDEPSLDPHHNGTGGSGSPDTLGLTSDIMTAEPMDCVPSPTVSTLSSPELQEDENMADNTRIDPEDNPAELHEDKDRLSVEDLQILADLFYLPFEHGKVGSQLLGEFNWLKMNSHLIAGQQAARNPNCGDTVVDTSADDTTIQTDQDMSKPEVDEWYSRARKFNDTCQSVKRMSNRLYKVRNRSLLYELYPYVWDMRGVVSLLNSYIEWLALGQVSPLVCNFVHGNYTWFSKGWREAFMSGDQEPWVFRGGLTAELQRLIPVDASNDLFAYKTPCVPLSNTFVIRPYLSTDKLEVYNFILKMSDVAIPNEMSDNNLEHLKAEMTIGAYLLESVGGNNTIKMIVEDSSGVIVGYCMASNNAKEHCDQAERAIVDKMRTKYLPPPAAIPDSIATLLNGLADEPQLPPESVLQAYPSCLTLNILESLLDESVVKRLLTCVLAALRSQGCFGVHATLPLSVETPQLQLYTKLGFMEATKHGKNIYFGRSF